MAALEGAVTKPNYNNTRRKASIYNVKLEQKQKLKAIWQPVVYI